MTTPRTAIWTFFYGTIMNPVVMKDFGVTVTDVFAAKLPGLERVARGGDRRLTTAGLEQGHHDVATEEPEDHQEGDPVGQVVRRRREPTRRWDRAHEREEHNAGREDDGEGLDEPARRPERRREAEEAVRASASPPRMANDSATQPAPRIR